jgi:hypothetical protein
MMAACATGLGGIGATVLTKYADPSDDMSADTDFVEEEDEVQVSDKEMNLWITPSVNTVVGPNPSQIQLMASIKAPRLTLDNPDRPPVDLVAVIDKSYSMSGEPMELVKSSLEYICKCPLCTSGRHA